MPSARIFRSLFLAVLTIVMMAGVRPAMAQVSDQQNLINRADLTLKEMRGNKDYTELDSLLPRARAVFIVPTLLKAAFFFGGEGGDGVMLARLPDGGWSAPPN